MVSSIFHSAQFLGQLRQGGGTYTVEFNIAERLNHESIPRLGEGEAEPKAERIGGLIHDCSILGNPWIHSAKGLYSQLIILERALVPFANENYRIAVCERVRLGSGDAGPWMLHGKPNILHIQSFLKANPDFDKERISDFISGNSEFNLFLEEHNIQKARQAFLDERKSMLLNLRATDFDGYFNAACEIAGGEDRLRKMLYADAEDGKVNKIENAPSLGDEFKEAFRRMFGKQPETSEPTMTYSLENIYQDPDNPQLWTICTGEVASPRAGSGFATQLIETETGFVKISRTSTWIA